MADQADIRWEQRFSNFKKALMKLSEAVGYIKDERYRRLQQSDDDETNHVVDEIIREGLIQRFEYTYEMAWNVMKDYALYQGNTEIGGSRDAIRFAFSTQLIDDGDMWMDMIKSRIKTSHTYDEETASEIFLKVVGEYHPAFLAFQEVMERKRLGDGANFFEKE